MLDIPGTCVTGFYCVFFADAFEAYLNDEKTIHNLGIGAAEFFYEQTLCVLQDQLLKKKSLHKFHICECLICCGNFQCFFRTILCINDFLHSWHSWGKFFRCFLKMW